MAGNGGELRRDARVTKSSPFLVGGRRENITAEKSLRGADKKRVHHAKVSLPASAHRYNTWLIKLIEQEVTSPSLVRVTLSRLPGLSFPFYYLNCLRECSIVDSFAGWLFSLSNIVLVHTERQSREHSTPLSSLIRLAPRDVSSFFSFVSR